MATICGERGRGFGDGAGFGFEFSVEEVVEGGEFCGFFFEV